MVQPKNIAIIDAASLKVSTSPAKSAKANLYATAMSQLNDCECNWTVDAESFRKWLVSHVVKSALSKDQETIETAITANFVQFLISKPLPAPSLQQTSRVEIFVRGKPNPLWRFGKMKLIRSRIKKKPICKKRLKTIPH